VWRLSSMHQSRAEELAAATFDRASYQLSRMHFPCLWMPFCSILEMGGISWMQKSLLLRRTCIRCQYDYVVGALDLQHATAPPPHCTSCVHDWTARIAVCAQHASPCTQRPWCAPLRKAHWSCRRPGGVRKSRPA
jgi:hypothetical protein